MQIVSTLTKETWEWLKFNGNFFCVSEVNRKGPRRVWFAEMPEQTLQTQKKLCSVKILSADYTSCYLASPKIFMEQSLVPINAQNGKKKLFGWERLGNLSALTLCQSQQVVWSGCSETLEQIGNDLHWEQMVSTETREKWKVILYIVNLTCATKDITKDSKSVWIAEMLEHKTHARNSKIAPLCKILFHD